MKLGLRRHGNTHDPQKGSDPIPGIGGSGIQFEVDNQGGWLDITARGPVPGDSDIGFRIRVLAEDGGAGDFDVDAEGNIRLNAAGVIISDSTGNEVQIGPGGFQVLLQTGDTYVIKDGSGNPLVTYTG